MPPLPQPWSSESADIVSRFIVSHLRDRRCRIMVEICEVLEDLELQYSNPVFCNAARPIRLAASAAFWQEVRPPHKMDIKEIVAWLKKPGLLIYGIDKWKSSLMNEPDSGNSRSYDFWNDALYNDSLERVAELRRNNGFLPQAAAIIKAIEPKHGRPLPTQIMNCIHFLMCEEHDQQLPSLPKGKNPARSLMAALAPSFR